MIEFLKCDFYFRQSTINASRSRYADGPSIHSHIEHVHNKAHRQHFTIELDAIESEYQFQWQQLHTYLPKWTE